MCGFYYSSLNESKQLKKRFMFVTNMQGRYSMISKCLLNIREKEKKPWVYFSCKASRIDMETIWSAVARSCTNVSLMHGEGPMIRWGDPVEGHTISDLLTQLVPPYFKCWWSLHLTGNVRNKKIKIKSPLCHPYTVAPWLGSHISKVKNHFWLLWCTP